MDPYMFMCANSYVTLYNNALILNITDDSYMGESWFQILFIIVT